MTRAERQYARALATKLQTMRVVSGLSQSELARRMHTRQQSIARLEAGADLPSVRTLVRFARACGADVAISFPWTHAAYARRLREENDHDDP